MSKEYVLSLKDDARLAAWHRQAQAHKVGQGAGPCITISREFGCQAYPLAELLARRFGEPWVVVDREILEEVAKVSGYSLEQIEKSRDTPPVLKAIFAMFLDNSLAEETQLFDHLRQAVKKFAVVGNCIIVGCGGAIVTREMKNTFHLRLVAPESYRVAKIMRSRNMNEKQATDFVQSNQQQRDDFIGRLAGQPLEDPLLYHLVLNNSLFSPEQMTAVVEAGLVQLGIISH
jgi:cytidylate kinase